MSREAWTEAIRPALRQTGQSLIISTPKGRNCFGNLQRGVNGEDGCNPGRPSAITIHRTRRKLEGGAARVAGHHIQAG
jgi:hypothetical protein